MSTHISFTDDHIGNQIELKENDELLDENGLLKKKGWSRQPCLKYNPDKLSKFRKAYRLKEWNYYSIGSNSFYFAVVAIDLGYLCSYQCFFIDFENDKNGVVDPTKPGYLMDEILMASAFSKGLCLPLDSCEQGIHTKYETKNFKIEFNSICDDDVKIEGHHHESVKHHVKVYSKKLNLEGDLIFDLSPKRESIVLVTPIGKDNFYYNRKTNLIPVSGSLKINGKELFGGGEGNDNFGILDWGRGIWDYNSFWLWSSAWGREEGGSNLAIGLNFGSGFGNLSTHTENAINIDGVIHKLGHVDIDYDQDDLLKPWSFTCKHGRFCDQPLIFTPFKKKFDNNDYKIFVSSFHQILGTFTGMITDDNGKIIKINLTGFTEVHRAKW